MLWCHPLRAGALGTSLLVAWGCAASAPPSAATSAGTPAANCAELGASTGYSFVAGDANAQILSEGRVLVATWEQGRPKLMPECRIQGAIYNYAASERRCASRVAGAASLEAFVPGISNRIGGGLVANDLVTFDMSATYLYTANRAVLRSEIEGPDQCQRDAQFFVRSYYWGQYSASRDNAEQASAQYGLASGQLSHADGMLEQGTGPLMIALEQLQGNTVCTDGRVPDPLASDRCINDPNRYTYRLRFTIDVQRCPDLNACDLQFRVTPPGKIATGPKNSNHATYDVPTPLSVPDLVGGVTIHVWDVDNFTQSDDMGSCSIRVDLKRLQEATNPEQQIGGVERCNGNYGITWTLSPERR